MISALTALVYALFGLIIGSFLNVVILRHGARTIGGRSGCLSCRAPLLWYDMIPVFSWFALGGRCRACGSRISLQYPLVEASTAILFVLVGLSALSIPLKTIAFLIVALLVLIAAYDIRHTIIPDSWAYAFAVLAFISASPFALSSSPQGGGFGILMLIIAGPVTALPLFALWFVSRGRWMGLGDAKLALGIGFLLGFPAGLTGLLLAFVIGAVVSLGMLVWYRYAPYISRAFGKAHGITRLEASAPALTMKSEVPFGPFLIVGCLLVWFAMIYGISLPPLFFFQ